MDSIKYIYFDDAVEVGNSIANSLSQEVLNVAFQSPFENLKQYCQKIIDGSYQGVILDQRLDKESDIDIRGTSIAQYLRTLASEGTIESFPIILLTAIENEKNYYKDQTAHDLFDRVYIRESLNASQIPKELISLASGYSVLKQNSELSELLMLSIDSIEELDYRLVSELNNRLENSKPKHEFALFFVNEVIEKNGALINESVLAARLGIDIEKNGEDWSLFKEKYLKEFEYKGIFSGGWKRWWMFMIESWWESFDSEELLSELQAKQRVDIINKKYATKLIEAQKTEKSCSTQFWTVCNVTKKPIDILDCILIEQPQPYSWQDEVYISIDELLMPQKKEYWKIHPSDKERAEEILKSNVKKRK